MTESEQSFSQRPTRAQLEEKKRYLKEMKSEGDTTSLKANSQEIVHFALGQGEVETKEEWYPGWHIEDFEDLLREAVEEGIVDDKYLQQLEDQK